MDSRGNACLLNWKSKKISRVVHNTIAAECLSLGDCIGDAHYIRSLIEEQLYQDHKAGIIPINFFTDS